MQVKVSFMSCLLAAVLLPSRPARAEAVLHSALAAKDLHLKVLTKETLAKDSGKLQGDTVYYLTNDLTLTGTKAEIRGSAGGNGLEVAENATVFIYIPANVTLTCVGGDGCDGEDGSQTGYPEGTSNEYTEDGISYNFPEFTIPSGGTGGKGASGGGAGIFLPASSKLAFFGDGVLQVSGGKGGKAGDGGAVDENNFGAYTIASYVTSNGHPAGETDDGGNMCAYLGSHSVANWKGKYTGATGTRWQACQNVVAQPTSGAGGGGGGGGGGAAIGFPGGSGAQGGVGGKSTNRLDWVKKVYEVRTVDGSGPTSVETSDDSVGSVFIGLKAENYTLIGGDGGDGSTGSRDALTKVCSSDVWYTTGRKSADKVEQTLYFHTGAGGGSGGQGGKGASIGQGGSGGRGGQGGGSGSVVCRLIQGSSTETHATAPLSPPPVTGTSGGCGASGAGEDAKPLSDDARPFNAIVFAEKTVAQTNWYHFGASQQRFGIPSYADPMYAAWRVDVGGVAATGLVNDSTALLGSDGNRYRPFEDVTVGKATYGDVALRLVHPQVPVGGRKAPITIVESGDFCKSQLAGLNFDMAEEKLATRGANGYELWTDYVLGIETDQTFAAFCAIVNGSAAVQIKSVALARDSVTDIKPPKDSSFNIRYSLFGTNRLAKTSERWPTVGVQYEQDEGHVFTHPIGGLTNGFFRLSANLEPISTQEGGY